MSLWEGRSGPAAGVLVGFDIVVLGPVELRSDGRREMSGSAKELQFLAALAVDVGKAVPLDVLIGRLWDDAPPGKPRASLHAFATRIRQRIGHDRLSQQASSYLLDIDPDAVDCHRFVRLSAQARSLASSGDDVQALALLRQAEELWRGTPLTGFTGLWAARTRHRFDEQRLAATLLRTEIELRTGRFAAVVGELSALAERYPTDEVVAGHFMTAAYACGRQTDALRAYEALRRRLRTEGTEPGAALARVHRRILAQAPVADLLPGPRPSAPPQAPHSLPASVERLVGRDAELQRLTAVAPGVIAFQAITGMGGVGKTQLALYVARRLAPHYPDAALFLNLQAHSRRQPLTAQAALTTLLRRLGTPATAIPHDPEDLTTLWRTVLSTRRAIIVLDDAAGPAQVKPLLPGDSTSLVLITSRRRLGGLPGVRQVFLDVLPATDAEALLAGLIGPEQSGGPAELAELARLCGGLPLALELAAGRLNSRPSWTVSHLVERIAGGTDRLAEIRDGQVEIASVLTLSYDTLPPQEQRVFRLLSLHFTTTFGPHATAALVALPLDATERLLEALLDVHLIREPAPERYEFHDLIAAVSHSLAAQDPEPVRDQARGRLADFYLQAFTAADVLIHPRRPRAELPPAGARFVLPGWPDPERAKNWLLAETGALLPAADQFRDHGRPERAARLAHAAAGFLDSEGLFAEAEQLHAFAAGFWHSTGQQGPEAHALIALAAVRSQAGRHEETEATARRALSVAQAVGDATAEAEAQRALGLLHWNSGRLEEARLRLQEALDIRLGMGDPWYIARFQNNLAMPLIQLGQHEAAMELFRSALSGFSQVGDIRGQGQTLNNMGDLYAHMGETDKAYDSFRRSLPLINEAGSRSEKAVAQLNLATVRPAGDDPAEALDTLREALAIFRSVNDKWGETETLNAIGGVLLAAGHHVEAAGHHAAALTLARGTGASLEEVKALRGAGVAELRAGRFTAASESLSSALRLARELRVTDQEASIHESFSELFLALGRRDESIRHLGTAHELVKNSSSRAALQLARRLEELTKSS
ncbi:tetratricopeptide repeat protein [Streptomyces sp. NBC_01476]|uniref:AfsR/SARP family transcriptional regulator n=1 Tax=Streptomyces sp. NBC_01476 TaxID=2903881 RepID=UPI002E2F70F1|nr:BTAD domain-containing putative transcriptional regulator [Streptomyces sp. NBC_01476]